MRRPKATNVTNRLLSLAILFGLAALVLLTPVFDRGITGGQATFCLGFILLFGYYLAKLLEGFHLPAITSYIIVGIVCGPFAVNLLSADVVQSLQLFDDVALAIIALMAGGELRLRVIRARKAAFASVIAGQTIFAFCGAVAVVYLLRGSLGDIPATGARELLAVGLLLGLVMVARSPSTTIGVIAETRARGPMTEVLIGVTVLLDVFVLVLAALVIPASETLIDPTGRFSIEFVRGLGATIFGSIAAGLCFGLLISVYIRWIGGYLPVILMVIGLVGSAVCRHYHLEPLLAFIVAGFIVENYSAQGDRLIQGLERSAFPVYVIFFAISGAAINLGALREMWLLALILVVVRASAYYAGTLAAARAVGELRPYAHSLWSGFLSQAGVTLGIASLITRRFEWGSDLETIVLAAVAINQLIGPVLLKWLLERKGEAGGMDRRD
jgi:Kef-type K+ transport system membrane component KefB